MIEVMASFPKEDIEKLQAKLSILSDEKEYRKVIYRAGRRAARSGVTVIKRKLSEVTTLKSSKIGEYIKDHITGGVNDDFTIGIKASRNVPPLSEFGFTPRAPRHGVPPTVEVYRGKKTTFEKGAFVAKMPSGHIGIYEQKVKGKAYPIRQIPGPSVAGIFKENEEVNTEAKDRVFEIFENRVIHELDWLFNK